MTNFTDERIAEARARCEAATKGPWEIVDGNSPHPEWSPWVYDDYPKDWAFIAAARTDFPDALDALVEARALIHSYEQLAQSSAYVNQNQLQKICTLMNERDEARRERDELKSELADRDETLRKWNEADDGEYTALRTQRDEAEALLLALHKAHHLDQGLEWKVDNLLHERGLLEDGK